MLTGALANAWCKKGALWRQTLDNGVLLLLTEKMSWQIWWHVPLDQVELVDEIRIA